MNILTNKAKCNNCGEIIESTYTHDWVQCSCGYLFVDGGKEYLRRGGKALDDKNGWVELSEYITFETIGAFLATKDGRRFGNAIVLNVTKDEVFGKLIEFETDFGNKVQLGYTILDEYFHKPTRQYSVEMWRDNRKALICHDH
jgi:hypothetical protein